MHKQKSTILIAGILLACLLSTLVFTGCNDEKKETSTETTVSDTIVTPPPPPIDTTHLDTANTRPIVPVN